MNQKSSMTTPNKSNSHQKISEAGECLVRHHDAIVQMYLDRIKRSAKIIWPLLAAIAVWWAIEIMRFQNDQTTTGTLIVSVGCTISASLLIYRYWKRLRQDCNQLTSYLHESKLNDRYRICELQGQIRQANHARSNAR